mgnify:CR=1 FL=1
MADQRIADALQAMQQLLQAQQQQAQQLGQGQQQQQPHVAAFARAPALANAGLLDYTQKADAAIFAGATKPLAATFSLRKPNVIVLLEELKEKTNTYGWTDIMRVTSNAVAYNVLDGHGRVTLAESQSHAGTYINASGRNAQNDYQLLCCLLASVDTETKKTMANESRAYTIAGVNANDPSNQSGLCYLKLLLQKAEADTRSVAAVIRGNLVQLPEYMANEAKQDIVAFNDYVREQMAALTSRGETSTDTLFNLFRAYLSCTDEKFTTYIQAYKDRYDEGDNVTIETLMTKAEQKYKTMSLEQQWNKPSAEKEELIALRAQFEELKKARPRKATPQRDDKKPVGIKGKPPKKGKDGKPIFEGDQAWRNVAPKEGESEVKNVDGKEWKYCKYHGYWCAHTSSKCNDKDRLQKEHTEHDEITAAMASIGIEDVVEDSEEEN